MLKVLIADDEKNICLMIQKLISWEDYGMEVIGLAYNGIEAVQMIEREKPQIVISDIRMPGYDGLEIIQKTRELNLDADFIIISGYRQFEYAHTALNLGVEHYLLKPIDKKELQETLDKIAEKHRVNKRREQKEAELQEQERSSKKQIRQHFLTDIIEKTGSLYQMQANASNQKAHYGFDEEYFIAMFAKLDGDDKEQDTVGLLRMLEEMIERDFAMGKGEHINTMVNSGIMTVLNYKPQDKPEVSPSIERTFRRILQELEKFKGFHLTVGVGSEKRSISETADSIQEAICAVKCREKTGVDRVIYYEQLRYKAFPVQEMFEKCRHEIENMVVALDYDALRGLTVKNLDQIRSQAFYSPVSVYEYLERMLEMILEGLRNNQTEETQVLQLETMIRREMDFYVDTGEMAYHVLLDVGQCFEELLSERKSRSHRPIRMAKQYVKDHYKSQVSLEEVADAIGLSPAYLSTMFKKEMGIHFSDYLTSCRMDAAKELLKDGSLSIGEVAQQVGYGDSKYFSKTFSKVVGLKPSVYRRMYC